MRQARVPGLPLDGARLGRPHGARARGRAQGGAGLPQHRRGDEGARREGHAQRDEPRPRRGRAPRDDRRRLAHGRGRSLRRSVPAHPARRHVAARPGAAAARAGATRRSTSSPSTGSPAPRSRSDATRARAGGPFTWSIRSRSRRASVFELVARAGGRRGPRGSIPANLAKALLRAPGLERIAKSPRAFLETLTTPVTYEARQRRRAARVARRRRVPAARVVRREARGVRARSTYAGAARRRSPTVEIEDPLGVGSRGRSLPGRRAWSSAGSSCARATSSSSRASSRRARGSRRSSPSTEETSSWRRPRRAPPSSTRCSTTSAASSAA